MSSLLNCRGMKVTCSATTSCSIAVLSLSANRSSVLSNQPMRARYSPASSPRGAGCPPAAAGWQRWPRAAERLQIAGYLQILLLHPKMNLPDINRSIAMCLLKTVPRNSFRTSLRLHDLKQSTHSYPYYTDRQGSRRAQKGGSKGDSRKENSFIVCKIDPPQYFDCGLATLRLCKYLH